MTQGSRIEYIKRKPAKLILFSELRPREGWKYVQIKVTPLYRGQEKNMTKKATQHHHYLFIKKNKLA